MTKSILWKSAFPLIVESEELIPVVTIFYSFISHMVFVLIQIRNLYTSLDEKPFISANKGFRLKKKQGFIAGRKLYSRHTLRAES